MDGTGLGQDWAPFYLERVRRFRLRIAEARAAQDVERLEIAVRCTVAALRACRGLGVGAEADALLAEPRA